MTLGVIFVFRKSFRDSFPHKLLVLISIQSTFYQNYEKKNKKAKTTTPTKMMYNPVNLSLLSIEWICRDVGHQIWLTRCFPHMFIYV